MCIRDSVLAAGDLNLLFAYRRKIYKELIYLGAVSYTHLDVYKRQAYECAVNLFLTD